MIRVIFEGAAGNTIVGDVQGNSGRPVLLLHGGGQTRHSWTRTARAVAAAGMRAYGVDQRGHGDSDWVSEGAYATEDFGADARRIIESLVVETGQRPVVVGASLGGLAALSLAAAGGEALFAGLVLVDVTPSLNASGLLKIRSFMSARMADGFASVEEAAEAVSVYLPGRPKPAGHEGLARNLRQRSDGRLRWHWDPAFMEGSRSVMSGGEEGADRLRRAAKALAVPTLLVRGDRSDLVTATEVEEFRSLVPHADFVDIAGAGHMVVGDRNDAFSDAILDFLSRHRF